MTDDKVERLQARLAQFRSDFGDDPPPLSEQVRYLVLENRRLKEQVKQADVVIGRLARQAAARIAQLTGERADVIMYDLLHALTKEGD